MPLNEVGRRYADRLFQKKLEEIVGVQGEKRASVQADFVRRGLLMSGPHMAEQARLLAEQINLLGEARADSLLKAYEKSGLPFDDAALQEIRSEVLQFCQEQQHNAVPAITSMIGRTFGAQSPSGLPDAVVQQLVTAVGGAISRIARDLDIRRDELILDEARTRKAYAAGMGKKWDVFISHASEDKEDFARPLADSLHRSGLLVWYDEFTLKVGDSLRQKIDEGLAQSRYGIVVLSTNFFAKNWPQHELDGLMAKEVAGTKVILPVWHNISSEEVRARSPMLAGLIAVKSDEGLDAVVKKLRQAMGL